MPAFPDGMDQLPENERLHHTLACRQRLCMLKLGEFLPNVVDAWSLPQWRVMYWLTHR